ncbi:hypothetical protein FPANT_4210 [Fusarium pseudoanthophilum]|uniref:Uncharacterized protein n=1 Tax=Fusarium pseudoanthophilum TaxID=48495 RepID=A0A8H5USS4_9HYPO|nr:hypothetical protein FPANT_4210 [Fusarium pseudoanthophilum]
MELLESQSMALESYCMAFAGNHSYATHIAFGYAKQTYAKANASEKATPRTTRASNIPKTPRHAQPSWFNSSVIVSLTMTSEAPVETDEIFQFLNKRASRAAKNFKDRTNQFPWAFLPEATRDSWGAQTLENLSGLSQKWEWQSKNNENPISLAKIHEALLQQMRSHREGVRNRLQQKDVNAVKDQFFQKRRNSSVADVSFPGPRNPALLQISVRTSTADETEVRGSETPPQPSPISQAPLETREPTQPLRLDTRDATTTANTENFHDFLAESGFDPDRSQSLSPTGDITSVGVPNAAKLRDPFDFSHVRPIDLPARYKEVHQQYSTALQDAKTRSNHSLAGLQKQLEEAHRAAGEFAGKMEEADAKGDAAAAKATEAKETIALIQDFLASSRRLSQHSSVHGLEEILTQQHNILSQSQKALKEAERTAAEAACEKSSAETKLTEANTKVMKLKKMIEARKTSAVDLDNESEHATRVAKLAKVGREGSRVLQDMFPAFFERLDEMIKESTEV